LELSFVIPCLNEEKTLASCIGKAKRFIKREGIVAEIIIADNGSTDLSKKIAIEEGAKVVEISRKGYGAAISGGIKVARGKYVIMGDADDSYDFEKLDVFLKQLRSGAQLVMGNRFEGGVDRNAMPFLHRYLGNPVLSFLGRLFFSSSIRDFHCGLRGFDRQSILKLQLTCPGMEFASEMVVKASLQGLKITEVPTTLKKDGRDRPPHLNTWKDGWRHLKFLLVYSPKWLFFYPGLFCFLIGAIGIGALSFGRLSIGNLTLDYHTMLYSSAFAVVGVQMISFAFISKTMGKVMQLWRSSDAMLKAVEIFIRERSLLVCFLLLLSGISLGILTIGEWGKGNYGPITDLNILRSSILSVTLIIVAGQGILSWFFLNSLLMFSEKES
jgi:glycosyltransferase involved in cell wall biosynthesis